jgi:hypothetical protein
MTRRLGMTAVVDGSRRSRAAAPFRASIERVSRYCCAAVQTSALHSHLRVRWPQGQQPSSIRTRAASERCGPASGDKGRFAKCARLDRGRCDDCGQPFIETIGGSAGLVFIPSANFEHQDALSPVHQHIYYRLREQDAADDLPKHRYFVRSQLAIAAMIGRVLRRA